MLLWAEASPLDPAALTGSLGFRAHLAAFSSFLGAAGRFLLAVRLGCGHHHWQTSASLEHFHFAECSPLCGLTSCLLLRCLPALSSVTPALGTALGVGQVDVFISQTVKLSVQWSWVPCSLYALWGLCCALYALSWGLVTPLCNWAGPVHSGVSACSLVSLVLSRYTKHIDSSEIKVWILSLFF